MICENTIIFVSILQHSCDNVDSNGLIVIRHPSIVFAPYGPTPHTNDLFIVYINP